MVPAGRYVMGVRSARCSMPFKTAFNVPSPAEHDDAGIVVFCELCGVAASVFRFGRFKAVNGGAVFLQPRFKLIGGMLGR